MRTPRSRSRRPELEDHGDALLDALIELLHLAPPHGAYRWGVIQRIEQSGDDRELRLGIAHGSHVISESAAAPAGVGGALRVGDVVLVGAEHRFVGLSPLVAAAKRDGVWELGLLKQELRAPRFQYAPYVGAAFRADVDAAQYADLLGSGPETEDAALDAAVAAMNPYRGLLAYHEEHAPLFFGRAESTDRALAMLEARGVSVIVGSSGSGKSSLMRAGVLAHRVAECDAAGRRLERILLRPGEHPMSALRNALRSIELDSPSEAADWEERIARLLPKDVAAAQSDGLRHLLAGLTRTRDVTLAVDQLEEAVTLCTDTAQRDAFLDALTTVAQEATEIGAHLVMTVRADLLAGLFDHPGMREVIRGHLVTLGALGRGDLLEVVRGPLRGRSVSVEDGLAERIVRDVGDEPGKLALLSQVLTTMWAERGKHGNRLTKDAYRSLGGVDGALRTQADAAWETIPEPDRAAADRALTRLANLGDDGRLVRSRPSLGEVAEAAGVAKSEVRALLGPFVEARLLVVGEPEPDPADAAADDVIVEVAHEALLRSWPRLHDQLRASQEAIALRQKIGAAQEAWASGKGSVWTDSTANLRRAEELLADGRLQATDAEKRFIDSSRRYVRRSKQLRGLAFVLIAVIGVASLVLWRQSQVAAAEAATSQERAEEVAAFILEDFNDALARLDRSEITTEALDTMERYFRSRVAAGDAMSERSWLLFALTLRSQSQAAWGRGEHEDAIEHVTEVLELTEEHDSADPNLHPRWEQNVIRALRVQGVLYQWQEHPDAEVRLDESFERLYRFVESDGVAQVAANGHLRPTWYGWILHDSYTRTDRWPPALDELRATHEQAISAIQRLGELDVEPAEQTEYQDGVLAALALLEQRYAEILLALQDPHSEASAALDRAMAHLDGVTRIDSEVAYATFLTYSRAGDVASASSDFVHAGENYRRALDAAQRYLILSPGHATSWALANIAQTGLWRALNAMDVADLEGARDAMGTVSSAMERLLAQDPDFSAALPLTIFATRFEQRLLALEGDLESSGDLQSEIDALVASVGDPALEASDAVLTMIYEWDVALARADRDATFAAADNLIEGAQALAEQGGAHPSQAGVLIGQLLYALVDVAAFELSEDAPDRARNTLSYLETIPLAADPLDPFFDAMGMPQSVALLEAWLRFAEGDVAEATRILDEHLDALEAIVTATNRDVPIRRVAAVGHELRALIAEASADAGSADAHRATATRLLDGVEGWTVR